MTLIKYLLFLFVLLASAARAEVIVKTNEATGLPQWETVDPVFTLELVPLFPDFVRATFMSKGIPNNIADAVGSYCVFGTIVRNLSSGPVSYDTRTWRFVTKDGVEHRVKTKSEWTDEWSDQGVTFRWSLLYEEQTFAVGDWGQGFTTVKLAPGTVFDLHYNFAQDGKTHERVIKEVSCAPEPEE